MFITRLTADALLKTGVNQKCKPNELHSTCDSNNTNPTISNHSYTQKIAKKRGIKRLHCLIEEEINANDECVEKSPKCLDEYDSVHGSEYLDEQLIKLKLMLPLGDKNKCYTINSDDTVNDYHKTSILYDLLSSSSSDNRDSFNSIYKRSQLGLGEFTHSQMEQFSEGKHSMEQSNCATLSRISDHKLMQAPHSVCDLDHVQLIHSHDSTSLHQPNCSTGQNNCFNVIIERLDTWSSHDLVDSTITAQPIRSDSANITEEPLDLSTTNLGNSSSAQSSALGVLKEDIGRVDVGKSRSICQLSEQMGPSQNGHLCEAKTDPVNVESPNSDLASTLTNSFKISHPHSDSLTTHSIDWQRVLHNSKSLNHIVNLILMSNMKLKIKRLDQGSFSFPILNEQFSIRGAVSELLKNYSTDSKLQSYDWRVGIRNGDDAGDVNADAATVDDDSAQNYFQSLQVNLINTHCDHEYEREFVSNGLIKLLYQMIALLKQPDEHFIKWFEDFKNNSHTDQSMPTDLLQLLSVYILKLLQNSTEDRINLLLHSWHRIFLLNLIEDNKLDILQSVIRWTKSRSGYHVHNTIDHHRLRVGNKATIDKRGHNWRKILKDKFRLCEEMRQLGIMCYSVNFNQIIYYLIKIGLFLVTNQPQSFRCEIMKQLKRAIVNSLTSTDANFNCQKNMSVNTVTYKTVNRILYKLFDVSKESIEDLCSNLFHDTIETQLSSIIVNTAQKL